MKHLKLPFYNHTCLSWVLPSWVLLKFLIFLAIMNSNYLNLQMYMGCKLKISYFIYLFSLFSNLSLSLVILTFKLSLFSLPLSIFSLHLSLFSLPLSLFSNLSLSLVLLTLRLSLSFLWVAVDRCWASMVIVGHGSAFLVVVVDSYFSVLVVVVVFCFFNLVVFQW